MKQMNGMELAKAVRYLVKPVSDDKLGEALDACLAKINDEPRDYVSLQYQGENLRLNRRDIVYTQVDGHYLKLVTMEETFEWKGSLKEMMDKLGKEQFVMVNRSTVVNLDYVNRICQLIMLMKYVNKLCYPKTRVLCKEIM